MVRPRTSLPFFKRNYLLDSIIVAIFVPTATFFNTAKKFVRYFALFLTLKGTVMKMEKALVNDCLGFSKVS